MESKYQSSDGRKKRGKLKYKHKHSELVYKNKELAQKQNTEHKNSAAEQ